MTPFVSLRDRLGVPEFLAIALLAVFVGFGCAGGSGKVAAEHGIPPLASTGNVELDRLIEVEYVPDTAGSYPLPDSLPYRGSLPFPFEYTAEDGYDHFAMELGSTGEVLACLVYPDEGELGLTAVRVLKAYGDVFEQQGTTFSRRALQQVVAGQVGGNAYHGVVWLWRADDGFAQPKAVSGNAAGRGVACAHFGLGQRRNLIGALEHLMTSLEGPSPVPQPYFEEISLAELDSQGVGVVSLKMFLDDEGDTEIRMEESTLIPTGGDSVAAEYGFKRSWARPDGRLLQAAVFASDLEEVQTNLELKAEEDRWHVEGTFQGKPLDQPLDHRAAIDSTRTEYLALARQLRPGGELDELTLTQWHADIDPIQPIALKLAVDPRDSSRAQVELGPVRMQAVRGPEGLIDRGTVPFGDRALSTRVLYRAGEL